MNLIKQVGTYIVVVFMILGAFFVVSAVLAGMWEAASPMVMPMLSKIIQALAHTP
jgi:hypothetical protein